METEATLERSLTPMPESFQLRPLPDETVSTPGPAGFSTLHIVGTPAGSWLEIAQALVAALPDRTTVVGGLHADGWRDIDTLTAANPGARFVALVDGPARTLALCLARGDGEPQAVLATWCDAASRLLRRAHARPENWMLVDSADAAAHPTALLRELGAWDSGWQGVSAALPTVVRPGALELAFAAGIVQADLHCVRLADELMASSVPLHDGDATQHRVDAAAAVAAYHALRSERDGLATSLQQAQTDSSTREAAQLDLQARLKRAADEAITLQRQLAGERMAVEALRSQIAEAGSERRSGAAAGLNQAANVEIDRLRGELAESRHDNDAMLLHLHRVQEEVERYYLDSLGQAPRSAARGLAGIGSDRATVRLAQVVDMGSHRHVQFDVTDWQHEGQLLSRLRFRVVDHLGKPGLVILASDDGPQPLSSWQPSGDENGRGFVTLIPSDADGRGRLQRMGTSDWNVVNALPHLAGRLLDSDADTLAPRWRVVLSQLVRQLADLPPRLRYDSLEVQAGPADGKQLAIRFGNTSFGGLSLRSMGLLWTHIGRDAETLHLMATDPAESLALSHWPVDADGLPLASVRLGVGSSLGAIEARRFWSSLSETDRALMLATLDALTAAADAAPAALLGGELTRDALRRAATARHKEARRLLARGTVREMLKRALKRGARAV